MGTDRDVTYTTVELLWPVVCCHLAGLVGYGFTDTLRVELARTAAEGSIRLGVRPGHPACRGFELERSDAALSVPLR